MTKICKNCNQHFKGNFCNTCGQSADTHEINTHFLWHDIQHGLLHFDNGIFYTIKELFSRPGFTIREYIEGKRVRHFKPLSFVIILATIYGLLYHNFHIDITQEFQLPYFSIDVTFYKKFYDWITSHYSWVTLLSLPLYALCSFFAFKKYNRNFVEHLILNAFLAGQRLVLHIVTFPILYLFNKTLHLVYATLILTIIDFILLFWGYSQFFEKDKKSNSFLPTIISSVLSTMTIILVVAIITVAILLLIKK